ncbi:MAG: hypothetical protein JWQ64_2295 [Subtercola sp.]|nr:hypothetical protein [Subtercola sp.]
MVNNRAFETINVDEALTLAVGWISGRRTKIRQVAVGHEVAAAFRDVANMTIEDLGSREGESWAPDADLSPETYLTIDANLVGTAPSLGSEHGNLSLLAALQSAETLPDMKPGDLPAGDLSFYAVVIGDVAGSRAVFLRRSNPRRGLKRGRIYSLLTDTLQRIEEPIFAFDEWMDLVAFGDDVFVLSQTVFAALFRDQDSLAQQVPQWATDLHSAVPIEAAGRQRLVERAQRDSRIRARLEAIVRRGHLASVSNEVLREAMTLAELDADSLISADGEFLLQEEDIAPVLYFLNEDLFSGSLTQTSFRADKKATRN